MDKRNEPIITGVAIDGADLVDNTQFCHGHEIWRVLKTSTDKTVQLGILSSLADPRNKMVPNAEFNRTPYFIPYNDDFTALDYNRSVPVNTGEYVYTTSRSAANAIAEDLYIHNTSDETDTATATSEPAPTTHDDMLIKHITNLLKNNGSELNAAVRNIVTDVLTGKNNGPADTSVMTISTKTAARMLAESYANKHHMHTDTFNVNFYETGENWFAYVAMEKYPRILQQYPTIQTERPFVIAKYLGHKACEDLLSEQLEKEIVTTSLDHTTRTIRIYYR